MREDIAKVICERPRRGGKYVRKKSHRRQLNRIDEDASLKGESMHRRRIYGWRAKEFNDFLEPIKGFLKKNAGRPWNKISSELSKLIPKDSTTNIHVWTHINQYVEIDPMFFDGRVYHRTQGSVRWGMGGLIELRPGEFFVSEHGIMLVYRKKRALKPAPSVERCEMTDLAHGYVKFGGQWYDVDFRVVALPPMIGTYLNAADDVFGLGYQDGLRQAYGSGPGVHCRVAIKKRLMPKSEVRQRVMKP